MAGRFSSALGSLVVVGAIASGGCDGSVTESNRTSDSGSSTDAGVDIVMDSMVVADAETETEADVDVPLAWHSFSMTVHDVVVKWDTFDPGTKPPSEGVVGRMDVLADATQVRGIVAGVYAEPVLVTGPAGSPSTLSTTLEKGALSATATDAVSSTWDMYRSFTVAFDAEGRPTSGDATGLTTTTQGDVIFTGTLHASLSFKVDRDPPLWNATTDITFADQPLPWDRRYLLCSEPYEGRVKTAAVIDPTGAAIAPQLFQSDLWGTTKERGFSFLPLDWDVAPSLVGTSSDFADLEGNHLDGFPIKMPFGGASVPRVAGSKLILPAGSAYKWGAADETEVCPPGSGAGACMVLGPFDTRVCPYGSRGGMAARIGTFGDAYINVRAVATPTLGTTGSPPDPSTFIYVHAQPPGSDVPSLGDLSSMKWPSSPAADGSFDTGWVTVRVPSYAPAGSLTIETGISIGVGGVGPKTPMPCGPPGPAPWSVTVDVGAIAIGAPP